MTNIPDARDSLNNVTDGDRSLCTGALLPRLLSQSPSNYFRTVEMHTSGEPVRIVVSGYPALLGPTLLAKREYARLHHDKLRTLLMHEPRGHYDMYGVLLTEPDDRNAHLGAIFIHNEGYSTMCGHATIALARYAVAAGLVPRSSPCTAVSIQCPCGVVQCQVLDDGRVAFSSVPAFVFAVDLDVPVDGYGNLKVDISYGGAFYAILPAQRVELDVRLSSCVELRAAADKVKRAVNDRVQVRHPSEPALSFLYGVIWTDGNDEFSSDPTANLCVFADREVDRSPTGSGVTARIALQYFRGDITLGQKRCFINSKVHTSDDCAFTGMALREVDLACAPGCDAKKAVVVEVSGKAFFTGECTFMVEPDDPLRDGFLLD